ncbi:MAG: 50S ribosomal protein L18 [Nitrospiraceae bacterium]|nr:MAG: 50S ribosomal protein L18 [Nitrospiraceae bacterium]
MSTATREEKRQLRHARVRKRVFGTTDKPRLNIFKSVNHIYAQIIDDTAGKTIVAASSIDKELKGRIKTGGNIEAAKLVGGLIAQRATGKGIGKVVFDRGGYLYHGRVKALADTAREGGLQF